MKKIIPMLVCAIIALAHGAQAQWSVGPHIVISIPSSDFANVSDVGGGFGLKVVRKLNTLSGIGLRGDFAFMSYGRDFDTVRDAAGNAFIAEVRNESFRLTFGPQYTLGKGSLRFHAGALGGFYFYRTNVNIDTGFGFVSGSRDEEAAVGWNVNGGLMFDIGLGPWLDLAVEYQTIYNIPAPEQNPNNPGEIIKRDITAHELTVKVGVTFFLGR